MTHPRTAVVVLAAGSGSRVGAEVNKVLLELRGEPVLGWSLRTVATLAYVDRVVVVHRPEDEQEVQRVVAATGVPDPVLVVGGPSRHASEWHALQALAGAVDAGEVDVVAIHDGARPLAPATLFDAVVDAAADHGGAVPVRPQPGLLATDPRAAAPGYLVAVQTPQAFRAADLLAAYRAAQREGFEGTDTAACLEWHAGLAVHAVPGPATNLKITFADDLELAERLLPG